MGAVIRLTDEIEKWLSGIHEKPHKALRIIKAGYSDHKDIISKLEDLEKQIENLKSY